MTNEEFQRLVLEKLDNLEQGQRDLEIEVKGISKKLDGVVEQTANLTEFRYEMKAELADVKRSISRIEVATAENWGDIAKLKAAR